MSGIDTGGPALQELTSNRQSSDRIVLSLACIAQFMVVLDVSVVNVGLPSIGRDLHYSPTGLQWVVNAYVLTFAGFLLLGGRAADLFGRRRTYLAGLALFSVASLVGGFAAFFCMWYFLSLYLQNVLGFGALRAGLAFFPMAVSIIIGAQLSSRSLTRLGCRPLLFAGTVLAGGGFAWLSQIPPAGSYWEHVFGPGCAIALALGLLFTPLAAAATAGVRATEAGLASGVLNTSRQMGGSLGLAILATVATDHTNSLLSNGSSVAVALSSGYGRAFAIAAGLVGAAFAVSFFVPNVGRPAADEALAPAATGPAAAPSASTLDPEPA
ncbi:MAG TPA: MFS transporter [Acidimicrobiales bacterium]|nr:MFS transporter [Acidimicrobiales bacterium]